MRSNKNIYPMLNCMLCYVFIVSVSTGQKNPMLNYNVI